MYYLGIDLGGTNIAAGLVDINGKILHKGSIPTEKDRKHQEILRDMAMLARRITEDAGVSLKTIECIGVGSPGTPDLENGILIYNNNLGFRNVPIRAELQKYLPLPVYLDNDANCAALAEGLIGAAEGVEHSVTITLGTGIGSGVIINHKIYSGFNNAGVELGHMVTVAGGNLCTCGRKGCWEAYASATALIKQAQAAALENQDSLLLQLVNGDIKKITAKTSFDAAKQGDQVAKGVVQQYLRYLADGFCNIINIFQPEVLVIGGGISKQGDYLITSLQKIIEQEIYSREEIPATKLRLASLDNDAGIVGAALLGFTSEQRSALTIKKIPRNS